MWKCLILGHLIQVMNLGNTTKFEPLSKNCSLTIALLSSVLMVFAFSLVDLHADVAAVTNSTALNIGDLETIRSIDSPASTDPKVGIQSKDDGQSEGSLLPLLTLLLLFICLSLLILAIWYVKILNQSRNAITDLVANKVENLSSNEDKVKEEGYKIDLENPNKSWSEPVAVESTVMSKESEPDVNKIPIRLPKPRQKVDLTKKSETSHKPVSGPEVKRIVRDVQILRKAGELEKALRQIESAEVTHPQNYDITLNKGIILEKLNSWDEALNHYEQAIVTDPKRHNGYLRKARLLERMHKVRESWECYHNISKKVA